LQCCSVNSKLQQRRPRFDCYASPLLLQCEGPDTSNSRIFIIQSENRHSRQNRLSLLQSGPDRCFAGKTKRVSQILNKAGNCCNFLFEVMFVNTKIPRYRVSQPGLPACSSSSRSPTQPKSWGRIEAGLAFWVRNLSLTSLKFMKLRCSASSMEADGCGLLSGKNRC
jgi:hypothetical protein